MPPRAECGGEDSDWCKEDKSPDKSLGSHEARIKDAEECTFELYLVLPSTSCFVLLASTCTE